VEFTEALRASCPDLPITISWTARLGTLAVFRTNTVAKR